MKKNLLIILFMGITFCFPIKAMASMSSAIEVIDNEIQNVNITVSDSKIQVSGANGEVLQVYNLAGVLVKVVKIEGADKRFDLNLPKGCYIVKVGKTVRKISIK